VNGDGHILLVDDDTDVRVCMRMILEDEGYAVDEAPDGPSALEQLRRQTPALLVVDYKMPGMTASELLDRARREGLVRAPVLLMTAAEDGADVAVHAHADGLLKKPFQLDELLQQVQAQLQRGSTT
jgi:two-component system response regulator (stage 0 sporulation protein F)